MNETVERRKVDERLERSRTAFYELIRNNPFGVYLVDADFRLREVSRGAQAVFSNVRPLLGRDFTDVLRVIWPEPFASEAAGRFRHTLETGEPYAAPGTVERRQDIGELEAYDWHIVRVALPEGRHGVVCYFYDLSERQRWEAALRESEQRFRTMADHLPLIVWVHDADGRQEFVNQTFCEYFGVTREEMRGGRWQMLMHPDDAGAYAAQFAACVRERRAFHAEVRVQRGDGEWRWLESWARPRFGPEGEYLGHIGTSADVTERKDASEALKAADRRKEQFLAVLAHELRNPVAPIRNAVEIMHLKGPPDATLHTALAIIDRQVIHLVRLVDDLLDVSRITQGKLELRREPTGLLSIIEQALETVHALPEYADHKISVSLPSEPLRLHADPVRLAQVFSNLLHNALRYSGPNGTVSVAVSSDAEAAVISVRDDGIGIPADKLDAVFGLFEQVERSQGELTGGLGIGLTLVKQLVELHGGTVKALSEGPGRGAEFVVRLPIADGPGAVTPPARRSSAQSALRRRILIVDDNIDNADSLATLLELAGHETHRAYDGITAVKTAEDLHPDVVLLDIGLPELDGYEACRRMRAHAWGKQALIVALTGWGQQADLDKSKAAGLDHHLVKPVDPAELMKLVAERR